MRNSEFKEFITPELPEISKDFLKEILISPKFNSAFKETVDRYNTHHREFGFSILKNPNSNELWYGEVVGGKNDYTVDLSKSTESIITKFHTQGTEHHEFMNLHIHPYHYGEMAIPTVHDGDLQDGNKFRIYSHIIEEADFIFPQISLIAVPNPKNINILAYRESLRHNPFDYKNILDELDESFEDVNNQEEVVRLMRNAGYLVESMTADFDCKFDEESIEKFQKFAFKPVSINITEKY